MNAFRLSSWSIRNPVPVAILFVTLTIMGIAAYMSLPVRQFPDVTVPVVVVNVAQAGAAPSEMETQITRKIEDAVSGINNVKHITSEVVQGSSSTQVEFNLGADLQKGVEDVRSAVEQTRQNLPSDIYPPNVFRVEADAQPIGYYSVQADAMSPTELSWFIDNTVARAVQSQKGVGQVTRLGGLDREINVTLDPDRMAALGVTSPQVNNALRTATNNVSGGRAEVGARETTIRVLGTPETVNEIRNITIPLAGGRYTRLGDVADVGEGAGEVRRFARWNGRPSVSFQVTMIKGGSEVQISKRIETALHKLQEQHKGVRFTPIYLASEDTEESFIATQHVLLEGMLLAALVVFLFLREWRSTAITMVAMPLSLIPTFAAMQMFGFSLNVVTLLALTLVIGILVDDAIVEIENIQKRIERGQRPYDAAMEGADAIGLAVIACTMTIVVVFTPVSFMNNMVGQYFKEFGLTVAVATLFSLLVARMLTPLLAAYFLKPTAQAKPPHRMPGFYRGLLTWALHHKWLSALFGFLFFAGSIGLVMSPLLPKGFLPTEDPGNLRLEVQGPPGATSADMESAIQQATRMLLAKPDVAMVFGSSGGGGEVTSGSLNIRLKEDRSLTTEEFKQSIRDELRQISDARVVTTGGFGGAEVEVILASQNGKLLERVQEQLIRQMRGVKEISDPRPAPLPPATELVVKPKMAEAAQLGVSTESIAQVARIATIGDIDANVAKFNEGERQIPIRVMMPKTARTDLDLIGRLQVPTTNGATVPLSSVADIYFAAGPAKIIRYDRERRMSVQADLNGTTLGQALDAIKKLPVMQKLPGDVHQAQQGDTEAFNDLFTGMVVAMLAGIAMIFAVLVLLFRSFFKPAIILSALPLSLGGAFLGLLLTRLTLSLPSMIGLFMLMGIAAKNSILLVEFAIEEERKGADRIHALMEACRERSRPIVMTTVAMAAGMLPTALGIGEGAGFRQPMAVAVIGGLISSTALSLVLVPVVYEIIDDIERWLAPKFGRFVTPREEPAPGAGRPRRRLWDRRPQPIVEPAE
ncbi:MAG TPA: efflux RND transporter permease subunit [Caulobacteraceae bacterium]|jgi:HAE1 family hydrophobic/amphiphilic exporter-1